MPPHTHLAPHRPIVLVVDAYPDAAESTAILLSLSGYVAHTATCGRAALDQARRLRPDVLVLDIPLPDGDGYALVRSLTAALGYRPRTVVVTGVHGLEERSRAAG
ncbi:MAG: response regulator, partial [Gemmataceae bacterium]